jgi:selenocysteine lyase/cysteine desulfurase
VREYGHIARDHNGLLLVDAAQSAGVVSIDVEADLIDLLAFTGHKGLLGVTGTGGLVVGERVDDVAPWREGGTGGDSRNPLQPDEFPYHLEGGTPNVFGIAGLREGVRILLERGVETVLDHERALLATFLGGIQGRELFSFYGADAVLSEHHGKGRVGLLSFNLAGFAPEELAVVLDEQFEIAVRPGLHCAPYAHKHLSTFPEGTVRVSVGLLNTHKEMLQAAAALNEVTES